MSLRTTFESTHTADAFTDFAYDLLEYSLTRYGYEWLELSCYKRKTRKVFRESFGDAVILYQQRHADVNDERINRYFEFSDHIANYAKFARLRIFKGDAPLMELFMYCACLVDMGIACLDFEDPEMLFSVVEECFEVFNEHVKDYFTTVGGWYALYRVAQQYQLYVTFIPQPAEGVCFALGAENVDSHCDSFKLDDSVDYVLSR